MVVSTIDPTFSWNTTGASAYAQRYGTSQDELWGVTYSAKSTGMLLLSPADSCVRYDLAHVEGNDAAANFSMQWSDQRVPIAIGVARVPRSNTTTAMREIVRFSLTLESDPAACTSSSMLSFTTQNKTRDALIQQMGRTFNMWYGNFIGNSPQGTLCMFETGILAMINTVFVPNHDGEGHQSELLASMRHQLEFFLKTAVNTTSGLIKNQWTSLGFALYPAMQQQQTQFLLALYHYCVTSGDKTLLTKYWNSTLMPIFTYLLKTMGLENNGYATAPDPRVSGVPGIVQSDNWMDTIDFGGADGVINAEANQVLMAYADAAAWIGEDTFSQRLTALHNITTRKYNELFWNESMGMYNDWVDTLGGRHHYAYVWEQAIAADPSSGILANNKTRLRILLNTLDEHYKHVLNKTNVTDAELWCTPINFINVSQGDSVVPWQHPYGTYENGACFFLMIGMEMSLRFHGGQPERALDRLERMLDRFSVDRLWGQNYNWNPASGGVQFNGADVLTDTNMALYALLRSGLRVRPTLTKGILIDGDAGRVMEGFSHTFLYQGKTMKATVVKGRSVVTPV
eukprot:PhF_6_TR37612/c0_g1_i2/m.55887